MDSNEYLITMLGLFLETTPEILKEIKKNVSNKNWDAVSEISHKLKSSLGPF